MSKNKTILLFLGLYPAKTGGMEVYNYRLWQRLSKEENIFLLSLSKVDSPNAIQVTDRMFGMRRWGLGYLSVFLYCLFSPKVKMREWNTVMIPYTSNFGLDAWPVMLFSKIFGFKYVLHCHGGGIKEWQYKKLQVSLFRHADKVAAVSHKITEEYLLRTGRPLQYLPPLVEFQNVDLTKEELRKKYGLENFSTVVLYVGSLKPLKSPGTLLKAFKLLQNGDTALVLAGDGELRKNLQRQYESEQIQFLGNVPNNKVSCLFAMSDIYVIPSWYEGTSVSLLEAMSKGLCCIGTNVMGINDMIVDRVNGLLFPKNDYTTLSSHLKFVIQDNRLAHELGAAAIKSYQNNYNYTKHISEILKFLNYA